MNTRRSVWLAALLFFVLFVAGCGESGTEAGVVDVIAPMIRSTIPAQGSVGAGINAMISVSFTEPMNPATVTTASFILMQGATIVPATVSYTGYVATLKPTAGLTASIVYTVTITTAVKDLAGNALALARTWTFTAGAATDITAPTVSSTSPAASAMGVAPNAIITANFSEGMDPATISDLTFTLKQGANHVPATVAYFGTVATLTPTGGNLTAATEYTVTITTGAEDLAGTALASAKTWTFTTGSDVDSTLPTVTFTDPANNAINIDINANIGATFSEVMDPLSVNPYTFSLHQGTTLIHADITYTGYVAMLNPLTDLSGNTVYTATLSTGIKDAAGNLLAPITWTFETGAGPDIVAPLVSSVSPTNNATNVAINANVTATFNETMDINTITTETFTLKQGLTTINGVVTYLGTVATFNPDADLAEDTVYTASITTGAMDMAGNPLAIVKTWTFRTGSTAAQGPIPIDLGTAGDYAILACSGISTVPPSEVNGNMGISPAQADAITGFDLILPAGSAFSTSSQVSSPWAVYAPGYASPTPANLTVSVNNMLTAYTAAADRLPVDFLNLHAGNVGGQTLVPGLYKYTAGLLATTDFWLDGGSNDVWVFQITGDFTMSSTVRMILAGGARAKNIFWQCSGIVTLNTTAHLEGIVLGKTQIWLKTGATANGRLLAQTAVDLESSVITPPVE